MRLKHYIQEEYFTRAKLRGKSYEIFINPSKKELREFKDDIRYIADLKKKKIFVWDAWGPLHDELWDIKLNRDLKNDIQKGDVIAGVAINMGNNYITNAFDGGAYVLAYLEDISIRDIDTYLKRIKFVDKYFETTKYIQGHLKRMGKLPSNKEIKRKSILDL